MGAVAVVSVIFDRPSSPAVNPSMKPYALYKERAAELSAETDNTLTTPLLSDCAVGLDEVFGG